MKPALHLIWSPLVFSITGFAMAREMAHTVPTDQDFQRFVLLAMPAAGLLIGWFIAYLATPIKMRPDTTFVSDAFASGEAGTKSVAIVAK